MTQTLPPQAGPTPPAPARSDARVLLVVGSVVAAVMIAWGAVSLVELAIARTTTTHTSYDAVGTVELVADGAVNVAAGPGGVEVDAVARSAIRHPRYSVDQQADKLVVTHRCSGWNWGLGLCSGGLDVTLPADTQVVVRTSDGEVRAAGLAGDVRLHTSNGRVEASGIGGPLEVATSNGEIVVEHAGADAHLRTSNGAVTARDVGGTLTIDTSNGRVDVQGVTGSATATTSNGRIDVADVGGDVRAITSNGEVVVRGGAEPVRLTIDTSNGSKTIKGATDPNATKTVEIRSSNGDVSYLAP